MTSRSAWHFLSIPLAAAALVVAWNGHAPPAPPAYDAGDWHAAVEDLRRQIADLAPSPGPATGTPTPMPSGERQPALPADLLPRLERLEQRVLELAARTATAAPVAAAANEVLQAELRKRAETERAAQIPRLLQTFLDTARPESERTRALGELRGLGPGARGGAVAAAAIALVQTSTSPEIRADVWRQMSRANEPVLVPHLLTSLQIDPEAKVREEAAETLGDYVDRPEVRVALQTAAANDAADGVRRQAERSLRGR